MYQALICAHTHYYGEFLKSLLDNLFLTSIIVDDQVNFMHKLSRMKNCLCVIDHYDFEFIKELKAKFQKMTFPLILVCSEDSFPANTDEYICLPRPLDVQQFLHVIHELLQSENHVDDVPLGETLGAPYLIGNSEAIQGIRRDIAKISKTDFSVLIQGETGTGKGVVAKAMHTNSNRSENRFMEVNCATLPSTLMESELFGYMKGAFTGAWSNRQGKFEAVSDGSLFLDEIAEMSPAMQAKLLQVLQDGEFTPLGGTDPVNLDVRILSATNADVRGLLHDELFRTDLFYRLAVITLFVPPLKDRPEDIVPLTIHFLERFANRYNKEPIILSSDLWDLLLVYDWPGNVRELENMMNTLVALDNEEMIYTGLEQRVEHIPQETALPLNVEIGINQRSSDAHQSVRLKEITSNAVASAEKILITEALKATNGNKKNAAKLLQMSYKSLLQKVKTYNVVL